MRGGFSREARDVAPVVPQNNHLLSVKPFAFVLGPGYEVIENGQVPQVLPGQAHDGSPPVLSNPAASASTPGTPPQHTIGASSPSPLTVPSVSQGAPFVESAAPTSVTPLPSGSFLPTVSSSGNALLSSSVFNSFPSTLSNDVATSTALSASLSGSSPTSSPVQSAAAVAPAAAVSSRNNVHGASFWAGIALLSLAVLATLITLFVWWHRVRKRTNKRPWESHWGWGRAESGDKLPEDTISSSGTSSSWRQPLRERDVGDPRHSTSTLLSSHGGPSHMQHLPTLTTMSAITHGPYPTVRPLPLELRHSDTSVPGLMQDVGFLRVANLVAGDILTSGDESTTPQTGLDDVGTSRQSSVMSKPRYLSLRGSGLDVPWVIASSSSSPPPPPRPINPTASPDHNQWEERLVERSTKPTESPVPPPPGAIETWRDSLRHNIASALGVFTTDPHPPPTRPNVTAYDWKHTTPSAVARADSAASSMTSRPWTLEETREGAGIVHIRGVPDPLPSSSRTSTIPRPLTPGLFFPRTPSPQASLVPPRLSYLPLPPEIPRTSGVRTISMKRQHGSRRRQSLMRRPSSSASSATSVGSDMSRVSGGTSMARWSQLSEKEEAARRALRQRRLQSVNTARKQRHGSDESRLVSFDFVSDVMSLQ
ncbi:hypothetical protein BGW80DRAFT_1562920 [Lactifluus volemus]|nr:hypothetical protein BGW80DRAFT_1562920 [Lactifluus volemus]